MESGFDGSSLAVFTGLTPASAVTFACLAAFLLASLVREGVALRSAEGGSLERAAVLARLRHLTALPLAVAWAGLIAAATHLGTPANALYAFSAIGTSPLSNEVAATVVFLLFSGVYWLYGFARAPRRVVEVLLLAFGIVGACVLLFHTSTAYAVPTVPSWNSGLASASVLLGALAAGLPLAAFVLAASEGASGVAGLARAPRSSSADDESVVAAPSFGRAPWLLPILSLACLVANMVVLGLYVDYLGGLGNNVVAVGSLSATYRLALPLYGVLSLSGLALQVLSLRKSREGAAARRGLRLALCAAGCLALLAAAVLVRFPFYEAYLSVGF